MISLTPKSIDELEGFVKGNNIEPYQPRWKQYKWTKAAERWRTTKQKESGHKNAFYRVSKGENWWLLDDLARGATGNDVAYGSGWNHTSQESLERVKLLFLMLGIDDRLQLKENPEWATPYDPRNVTNGIQASRKIV